MAAQRGISPRLLEHVITELKLDDQLVSISVEHLTRLVIGVQEWADKVIGLEVTVTPMNEEYTQHALLAAKEALKRKLSYEVMEQGYVMCRLPEMKISRAGAGQLWETLVVSISVPVRKA